MRVRGFTLVEVMVALAVVAVALPALLTTVYQQVDDTAYLRDKTIARIVAANKLAEMRLVIASTRNLTAGKDSGPARMADRDWYWWVETKTTEAEQFYRVEIRVAEEEAQQDQPLYTLTAFMSGDLEIDPDAGNGSETGGTSERTTTGAGGSVPGIGDGADARPNTLSQPPSAISPDGR